MDRFNTYNEKYQRLFNALERLGLMPKTEYVDFDKHVRLTTNIRQKTGFSGIVSFDIYEEKDFERIYEEILLVEKINSLGKDPVIVIPGKELPQPGHGYFEYQDKNGKPLNIYDLRYMAQVRENESQIQLRTDTYDLSKIGDDIQEEQRKLDEIKYNYGSLVSSVDEVKKKSNSILGARSKINVSQYGKLKMYEKGIVFEISQFVDVLDNNERVNQMIDNLVNTILFGQRVLIVPGEIRKLSLEETGKLQKIISIIKNKLDTLKNELTTEVTEKQSKLSELLTKCKDINALSPKELTAAIEGLNPSMEDIQDIEHKPSSEQYRHDRVDMHPKFATEEALPSNSEWTVGNSLNSTYTYDKVSYDSLIELQKRQSELLTPEEKAALIVYKTQLYRAMNPVIAYMRQNNLTFAEAMQNEEVLNLIKKAYAEYKEGYDSAKQRGVDTRKSGSAAADRVLQNYQNYDGFSTLEQYTELIFRYLPSVESSLKKITTTEDIVVYRGVPKDKVEIPNHFISTSLASGAAKTFAKRPVAGNTTFDFLGFYEIIIPAGSPVIVYNEELFSGYGEHKKYLDDSQQELLIDPSLFEFKYMPGARRTNYVNVGGQERILTYEQLMAIPKPLELEEEKDATLGTLSA